MPANKTPKENPADDSNESADTAVSGDNATKKAPKKKASATLSLIDKKVRKKKPEPEPEPAPPTAEDKRKAREDAAPEALSLFEKQERKGTVKKRIFEPKSAESSGFLPPISKFLEEDKPAEASAPATEIDPNADPLIIHIKPPIIVKDLAERMGMKPFKIMKDLMAMDIFANPDSPIEPDAASKICEKHGFTFEQERREKGAGVHKVEEIIEEPIAIIEEPEDDLKPRPPIVTLMGHVDHGKTSLLDAIRKSRVTAGEAGGITQHIDAYSVEHNGQNITFIDTPGHQAFTEMRARGAHVTDIVVLVVAADDGLMPTTMEAISHARAANVSIIIAINKVDMPTANVDRVKAQLQENDLSPEEWGGSTLCVETVATSGQGVDELLETISLQAEIMELKANPKGSARAMVIEAKSRAGRGNTASVIVETGTLKIGMPFISGPHYGKIKSLFNDQGDSIKEAGPAMPVEILGFSGLPNVGDEMVEMDSERSAKKLSEERQTSLRAAKLALPQKSTLENFFSGLEEGIKKDLKIILKADAQGSLQAICKSFEDLKSEKIKLSVIHQAAGPVTESDIMLASASDAAIIGFNVKVEGKAVTVAKREGVQVKLFSIIYELLDQIEESLLGMLDPETRERIIGHAEIKEVFKLSSGIVAGCIVTDGKVARSAHARVMRGKQPVFDGKMATLRRFSDEVKEVKTGLECGIRLGSFTEYEKGDVIECYELDKLANKL
jgi:translation initiation factor IF-2